MNRKDALRELSEIAREQAGYVSSAQAKRAGIPNKDLVRFADSGVLQRVARGVYALPGTFRGPKEDVLVAWVRLARGRLPWDASGPSAVASHTTAADLHDFGTFAPDVPTFTVERGRFRPTDETLRLYTAHLDPADWQWLTVSDGARLAVTTPARTIVDVAYASADRDHVLDALADARDAGLVDDSAVRDALDRRRRRRGRGSAGWLEGALTPR